MFAIRIDDNLSLRPPDDRDAEALLAIVDTNRELFRRWLGWVDQMQNPANVRDYFQRYRKDLVENGSRGFVIRYDGRIVGWVVLIVRDASTQKAEIGYWMDEAAGGKGIMTRAARAVTDYAFGQPGMNRLIIRCGPGNTKSCGVAERLGFTYEGLLRQEVKLHFGYDDVKLYAMLAQDWDGPRDTVLAWRVDDEVSLRQFEPHHAEALYALIDANREHLRQWRQWLPWVDQSNSIAVTRDFIHRALDQYTANNGVQCGIWYRGELAGAIGYHKWDFDHRKTEIGYWLAQTFTGKGIMTRAARKLVDYAVYELDLNRVEIRCGTENAASCAVAKRLNMQHEGMMRQAEWVNDHYVDWNIFATHAADWRERRESL